jgi:hypothetical protein
MLKDMNVFSGRFYKMAVAATDMRMFWRTASNLRTLKCITPKIEKCVKWNDIIIIIAMYCFVLLT